MTIHVIKSLILYVVMFLGSVIIFIILGAGAIVLGSVIAKLLGGV